MAWISPTGSDDGDWGDRDHTYDDNEATYALYTENTPDWSPILVLTHAAINCDRVRIYSYQRYNDGEWHDETEEYRDFSIRVYRNGEWVEVFVGALDQNEWTEKSFTGGSVTKIELKGRSTRTDVVAQTQIKEVDFWGYVGPLPMHFR